MKKIYLACSFAYADKQKTQERKDIMLKVKNLLVLKGYQVYNPSQLKIENAWDYSMYDWGKQVFNHDVKALNEADLVIFLSFGKENNAGSVWEVGYAYCRKTPVIMVSMNPDSAESLMVIHSASACLKGLEGLKNFDFENIKFGYNEIYDVVES